MFTGMCQDALHEAASMEAIMDKNKKGTGRSALGKEIQDETPLAGSREGKRDVGDLSD
jgi:hypothetical protein